MPSLGVLATLWALLAMDSEILSRHALRHDENGMASVGEAGKWVAILVGLFLVFVLVSALWPTVQTALASLNTTMGNDISAAMVIIVPIAVAIGILLYVLRSTDIL